MQMNKLCPKVPWKVAKCPCLTYVQSYNELLAMQMNELVSLSREGLFLMAPEEGQYTTAVNKDKSIHGDIRNCIYVSSLYKTWHIMSAPV